MLRAIGIVSIAAFCLLSSAASAQSITVMPVVVDMQPGQLAATLAVSTQDASETSYQARAFAWSQDGDVDRLEPTRDLLLSPPLGVIQPNSNQIIRLVVRRAPKDRESVYRILLDQIPPPSRAGEVRVALRLSLPVFVRPMTRTAAAMEWRIERDSEGACLVAENKGTRHERIRDIELTSGSDTFKPKGDGAPYILAGATRRICLTGSGPLPEPGSDLHLHAQSNAGKIDALVHTTQRE